MWFYFCSVQVFLQIQIFVTDLVTLTGYYVAKSTFFLNSGGGQETITVENHVIKLAEKRCFMYYR